MKSDPSAGSAAFCFGAIAGIHSARWFNKEYGAFCLGYWSVLGVTGNYQHLTLLEHDRVVPKLDGERSVKDEEHLVGIWVRVPVEGATQLGELYLLPIEGCHDPRRPMIVEER